MFTRMRAAGPSRGLGAGLIVLALWLQLLAPAAGVLSRARQAGAAAADALIHAVLCGQAQDLGRDLGSATELPAERASCDHCPLCRCAPALPLPVMPEALVARLVWQRVLWPIPPPLHGVRPPRTAVQARAPPGTV